MMRGADFLTDSRSDPPVVLVVEDEPLLLLMACDMAEEAGFVVVSASNADRAIEILENRPDIRIVFTDIDMPGSMDGMRMAAAIRDRWPPIHLILTSGKQRPAPCDMPPHSVFYAKPYPQDRVVATMRSMAG